MKGCEACENVVTPVARCQGHTTPRSEAGEFLGVGLQPGLGVRAPFTVQVDPERIMAHWQAWHMRKGLCIALPCLAYEASCHLQNKKQHEHIFWGRKAAIEHLEKCHEGYTEKEGSAYLDEDKAAVVTRCPRLELSIFGVTGIRIFVHLLFEYSNIRYVFTWTKCYTLLPIKTFFETSKYVDL